jgi:hypothetical protein
MEELKKFLIESNNAGYTTGDEKQWIKEKDGSTTIPFSKGAFRSHDNFFGGEPYGGRLVVYKDEKPFWIMVYYGWIEKGITPDPVYAVLRKALKNMPPDAPFRGPAFLEVNGYRYENTWKGDISRYAGEEKIMQKGDLVYYASYIGGLVDLQTSL